MTMGIEIGMTEGVGSPVVDRVEELRDDMEDGFSDLRSKVQEMDADELRREISLLMMIGSSQMETMRILRRDVKVMNQDLIRLQGERVKFERVTKELAEVMGIPFDPDDWSPAKLVRTATTIAGKYAERHMPTLEMEIAKTEAATDGRKSRAETVTVVAFSVFVLCMVVWTVLMVSAWVR